MPKIELAELPGLENAQGLFGSITQNGVVYDDTIVDIMVFIYDTGVTSVVA